MQHCTSITEATAPLDSLAALLSDLRLAAWATVTDVNFGVSARPKLQALQDVFTALNEESERAA